MKYGLSEPQLKEITTIIASYDAVEEAILFGSRAIDTFKEASDVDIAIKGKNADWSLALTLKDHLEEETYLPFFFDVVAYGRIESKELKRHIDGKGKSLFCRGMSEWGECELGELTIKIGSGATPHGGSNSYIDEGISLIRSQNVLDLRFTVNGLAFIDDGQAASLKNVIVKQNDILLNITGDSVARVCKVPNEILPARVNQHVAIIRANNEKLSPYFLLYNLIFQKEGLLSQSEIGATRRAITKGMIEKFSISLPPLPEQKAIAEVLSALDDKIDLLHRQNKTLEQMAETLFRQWFVEEAQDDWDFTTFEKWITGTVGGEWGKENSQGDFSKPVICIRGTDIANLNTGLANKAPLRYVKENKFEKITPKTGDIIIEISGGTENQSTGRTTYINDDIKDLFQYPLIFSNFSRLIIIRKVEYSLFVYLYFQYLYKNNEFFNLENGSSGIKNLDYKTLLFKSEFIMPSEEKVIKFNKIVKSNFSKINKNKSQINTLGSLRDTLLPKLMSGEVRIASNG